MSQQTPHSESPEQNQTPHKGSTYASDAVSGNASRESQPASQWTGQVITRPVNQSHPQKKRDSRVVQVQPTGVTPSHTLYCHFLNIFLWMLEKRPCVPSQPVRGEPTVSCWPSLSLFWALQHSWASTSLCGETSAAWRRTKLTSSSNSRRGRSAGLLHKAQSCSKVFDVIFIVFIYLLELKAVNYSYCGCVAHRSGSALQPRGSDSCAGDIQGAAVEVWAQYCTRSVSTAVTWVGVIWF